MVGITVGLLIMFFGAGLVFSHHYGMAIELWPAAFIILGAMIIWAALSARRRPR